LNIRILSRDEIDDAAWNHCLEQAPFSLVYACSWYLDALCSRQWSGLIIGDYEGLMPLPHKIKFGISYLYQPYFCQQLGLFGDQKLLPGILDLLQKKYRFAELGFHTSSMPLTEFRKRTTYWLDLRRGYGEISAAYNKDARKNLRRLQETFGNCRLEASKDFSGLIQMFRMAYGNMNPAIGTDDYDRLLKALIQADKQQAVEAFLLRAENGSLLAGGIFLRSREHYHYVLGGPAGNGQVNGVHALIDGFIRLHAREAAWLDFEGSEIPSVAAFYRKFGPEAVPYFTWKMNRLPAPLRWLKS
jgi:hypothetical protein